MGLENLDIAGSIKADGREFTKKELAEKLATAGASTDLFMTPKEQMAIDNFHRLCEGIQSKLRGEDPKMPDNKLWNESTRLTIQVDPEGWRAVEKWADMFEQFFLNEQ